MPRLPKKVADAGKADIERAAGKRGNREAPELQRDGVVRLPVADVDGRKMRLWRLCSGGNFGDVVPGAKGGIASRTMLVGTEVMTAELEMVVDPAVGGEKTLRVTR